MVGKQNKCPNSGKCVHMKKTFEELKKDFPYFQVKSLEELQWFVCDLCNRESRGIYDYKNHRYR